MQLPAPIYMLEVIAVVGDAANPESGAELRADVAAVVEALKALRRQIASSIQLPSLSWNWRRKRSGIFTSRWGPSSRVSITQEAKHG
jgi:hypothetical protein